MKYIKLTTLIFGLLIFGCNQAGNKTISVTEEKASSSTDDKEQIQNLIRQTFNWVDSKNSIDILPVLTDSKNSIYIGFDLDKHKQNLVILRQTNFFAKEFIDNYNQIILTLDKGLRNGEYEQWLVGDLPTFIFANNQSPWCMCQDTPSAVTGSIEVMKIDNKSGELFWKWGADSDWINFKIRVIKENDKWRIAYLQGFDLKENIKKDGQL